MRICRELKLFGKEFLIDIVAISIIGTLLHFLYEFSGKNFLVAIFSAVNESVWEHLKLSFYPLALLMLVPLTGWQQKKAFGIRVQYAAVATFLSMLIVSFGYYGLHNGWGITETGWSLAVDIGLLFLGNIVGSLYAFYRLRCQDENDGSNDLLRTTISVLFLVGMVILFACFTSTPLPLEIFRVP